MLRVRKAALVALIASVSLHSSVTAQQTLAFSLFEQYLEPLRQQTGIPGISAAVLQDGRELLSADTRARHRLTGPSSVQASLAALVREDILTREGSRYVVVDSLFREWVARRTF